MDFKSKYLKYKSKYLTLRNKLQLGGTNLDQFLLLPILTPFQTALVRIIVIEGRDEPDDHIEYIYNNIFDGSEDKTLKFDIINTDIDNLLKRYPGNITINNFKNDTSSIIFVFDTIVIKVFKITTIDSLQHQELYDLLLQNKSPYLEEIYEVYKNERNNLYYIISKKIDTELFKAKLVENQDNIRRDIRLSLEYLGDNGWNHNDTRIDNIGYDISSDTYRLFDFGVTKKNQENLLQSFESDLQNLESSIKFNIKHPNLFK